MSRRGDAVWLPSGHGQGWRGPVWDRPGSTLGAAVILWLLIQKGVTVVGHHRGKTFVPGRMHGFRAVEGQSRVPGEEEKSEKLYPLPLLDHPSQRLKCIFS